MMIEGVADFFRRKVFFQIEMRRLAQGMNPGIGAAGADDSDLFAGELFDRRFKRPLHRGAIVLALPADKGAAVIFEAKPIAHQMSFVPAGNGKPLSSSPASIPRLPARCTFFN